MDVEPREFAFAPGGKALDHPGDLGNDDITGEQAFAFGGLLKGEERRQQACGSQFVPARSIVNGTEPRPISG